MTTQRSLWTDSKANYDDYISSYPLIDPYLRAFLRRLKQRVYEDDDALVLITGQVGSGKSTLSHHVHHTWTLGRPKIDNVAFDRRHLANILVESMKHEDKHMRVCHYDEANITKREAMTRFNRKIIDVFEVIRAKNGLHIWCNPSAEYLDKKFIDERVKCLIYTFRYPRGKYMLIPRKSLLHLIDKHKNLKQDTLERFGNEVAGIKKQRGWFRKYPKNKFLKEYLERKDSRQDFKLDEFKEEFGGSEAYYSLSDAARAFGMVWPTAQKYINKAIEDGVFAESEVKTPNGRWKLKKKHIDALNNYIKEEQYAK